MRNLIHAALGVLFLGMSVGCLHSPPVGATRGIVLLENANYMYPVSANAIPARLTGIAIDEHTILTAAHLFRYDPEPGHPLMVNGHRVGYSVLSDGWSGHRDPSKELRTKMTNKITLSDVLLLLVDEPVVEFAEYVEFGMENYDLLSDITLVTNEVESGLPVAVPLRRLEFDGFDELVFATLSQRKQDKYYLSGSPVVATYSDGSVVLLGIAVANGVIDNAFAGIKISQEHGFIITPLDFLEARSSVSQAESK